MGARRVPRGADALVPGEPPVVRRAGQPHPGDLRRHVTEGSQSGHAHLGRHLAPPPVPLQLGAEPLLRALGAGPGLDVGGQSPLLVPRPDTPQRLVQGNSGIAEREYGIGAPGESRGGAQPPVAQGLALRRLPGARRDAGELLERGTGPPAPGRGGGHHLARHQRGLRDADTLAGAGCDRQHTVVPRCENAYCIGELRACPAPSTVCRTETRLPTSSAVIRTSSRPPMVNSTAQSAPPVRIVPRNGDTRCGHRRRRAPAREPTPYRGGTTA